MHLRDRILELRRVPAKELAPHPKNWRTHPKRQQEALRGILAEIGYADALLARETPDGLQLIDGHLRAELTPDQAVPVLVLDVDEQEADKLLASLDPLSAMAGKDDELLRELLDGVDTQSDALQDLFDELSPPDPLDGLTDPDDVPEPPAEAVTQPGDLWILGEHRLLCGDSASAADVDRLLDGAPVHLINMDPPFNVNVEPRSKGALAAAGKSRHGGTTEALRPRDRVLLNDFVSDDEFKKLLAVWFGNASRVLVPGRGFYFWGGYSNCANYPSALEAADLYFSQAIIWVKQHPVMTRKDFMGDHEWCFYGWKKGAAHYFHPAIHNATDVWTVKKVSPQKMIHLTEKPVELAVRAMEYSSRRGENVLDLFGGSGSTLIGAQQKERKAFLMELDPLYCDVIVNRFEAFAGQKAERISA